MDRPVLRLPVRAWLVVALLDALLWALVLGVLFGLGYLVMALMALR